MVRGIERRNIFLDDVDRESYVDRLGQTVLETGAHCYAWALMDNHVHLVVKSGAEPVSKLMQRLGTSYAVRFNRRYDRVGHLFQNRFKSRIVDGEEHLRLAIRYVHRNPVEAGIVCSLRALETYSWTGYGALIGRRPAAFEAVEAVLRLFGGDAACGRTRLREFMQSEPDGAAISSGDRESKARVQAPTPGPSIAGRSNRTSATRSRPGDDGDLERLIARVCRIAQVSMDDVLAGRRDRSTTRARAIVAYLATRELAIPGVRVARALGSSEAAVSKAIRRAGEFSIPRRLREEVKKLRTSP